jgi:outer membrane protein assembly factor BamB
MWSLAAALAASPLHAGLEAAERLGGQGSGDRCGGIPPLEILFRFGTGARAAAPPTVAADGGVYVGTTDGYVHALRADGAYRWSYTLTGAVVGRAAVTDSGTLLVPTRRRIYALRPNGTLLWVFASPVPVLSDLVRDGIGRFHFASDGGRLFALSGRGALVAHVPGSSTFTTPPVALTNGGIAAGRADGRVIATRPGKNQQFALAESVSAVLPCPNAELCAVSGGMLRGLGTPTSNFTTRATRAASNRELLAVLTGDTQLELFRGAAAERLFSLALPEAASAAPVIDDTGRVFVGLRSGMLVSVSADGTFVGCTTLGHTPLGTPVLDLPRTRVLVTLAEGTLVSIGAG